MLQSNWILNIHFKNRSQRPQKSSCFPKVKSGFTVKPTISHSSKPSLPPHPIPMSTRLRVLTSEWPPSTHPGPRCCPARSERNRLAFSRRFHGWENFAVKNGNTVFLWDISMGYMIFLWDYGICVSDISMGYLSGIFVWDIFMG